MKVNFKKEEILNLNGNEIIKLVILIKKLLLNLKWRYSKFKFESFN